MIYRLVIAALALLACAGARAQTDRPVTLKAASPSLTTAASLTMVAGHTDKAHGLAVELMASGTSSTVVIDAVLAGQADFGSPGTADALQAIRQGAKLKIIAAIVNNLQVMVIRDDVLAKLGVAPNAPIADRVRALKGLTIATGAVGSTHYQILRSYLKKYGIDPDKNVRLVGMGEAAGLIAGIEQKRFDAIAYASPVVDFAIAKGIATLWISGPRGDIQGSDSVKTCVIVARTETVEKRPAEVEALRAALADALATIGKDHTGTGDLLRAKYFPNLDPKVWQAAWDGAAQAYPTSLAFSRDAFAYWIANDPKGADSYRDVDYAQIVYGPAQRD